MFIDHLFFSSFSFVASIASMSIPRIVSGALFHLGWHHAMIDETNALNSNSAWDLIDLPIGKKVIGCKWLFTVKFNANGSIASLRARLVANGFAQTHGGDYDCAKVCLITNISSSN